MKRIVLPVVVALAVAALAADGAETADLLRDLKSKETDTRRTAARELGERKADAAVVVPALVEALKDDDLFVRRFAAQSLGALGSAAGDAVKPLAARLTDPREKPEVQLAAVVSLGKLGKPAVPALTGVVKKSPELTPDARFKAVEALAAIGPDAHPAVPALTDVVSAQGGKGKNNQDGDLRTSAVTALGKIANAKDTAALEVLKGLAAAEKGVDKDLKKAAGQAVKKIEAREP